MSVPEDSRPFEVLRQNAADFKTGFDEDINSCLGLLDSKLSALISEPGTTNTPSKDGNRLSVDIQFTRAKYDIYVHMKTLFDEIESSWREQLEEMRNNFLENVEILLAKTKLHEKVLQNDGKKSLKNRKVRTESPAATSNSAFSLLSKAKKLPVLSSLLPQTHESDEEMDENGYSLDHASKSSQIPQSSPPKPNKSLIKRSPSPKKPQVQNMEDDSSNTTDQDDEEEIEILEGVSARSNRIKARSLGILKSTPMKKAKVVLTPQKRSTAKNRKSILKPDSLIESELHTTPSRSTRKRTAVKDTNIDLSGNPEIIIKIKKGASDAMEYEDNDMDVAPKTPKNVHFSMGLNVHEDLEIYSPEVNLTRSAPRRKTVMTEVEENFTDISLTPVGRPKSKRKTIGSGVTDVPVAPSPKRFKSSRNSNISAITEESEDADLSRSESSVSGHYTPWLLIEDLDGKVPSQPGVYELKVYKAKKSAYIGSCDNLRQKLTLHKLGGNSGHKHLDKFLERNRKDVQVRYEIMPSAAQAKTEEMKRIKAFVELYHTSPSYN